MKLFGLPVLAQEDKNFIAVFSGQIIVPRDLAFHTKVFMKIYIMLSLSQSLEVLHTLVYSYYLRGEKLTERSEVSFYPPRVIF